MSTKTPVKTPLSLGEKAALRAAVVAVALSQVGVEESPRGSNWGNLVKAYLAYVGIHDPASWCMAFACWSVGTGAARIKKDFAQTTLIKTGYCPSQVDHARSLGTLISAADAAKKPGLVKAGDLMVMNIPSEGGYHHTGVVIVAPNADGDFKTVEGNTNDTGGSQGWGVLVQRRNLHQHAADGTAEYAFIVIC